MSEIEEPREEFEVVEEPRTRRRIHPAAIAAGIVGVVVVLFLSIWLATRSGSGGGQPVPAPRSMTMDETATGSEPMANQTISPVTPMIIVPQTTAQYSIFSA